MILLPALFGVLTACEEPPPPPPPAPSCDLTLDTLAGKTFVQTKKGDAGGYEADKLARMRFVQNGDALQVKYTVHSLTSVYDYTCTPKSGELTCMQDSPDLVEFCRSLWANTGSCKEDTLAQVTGVDAASPDVKAAVERVNGELAKQSDADKAKTKAAYGDNENVQLRGVLHVRVKATDDECRLSVDDMFQNFSHGSSREMENYVGRGARFAKTDTQYVFDDCRDVNSSLVASADPKAMPKPGQSQLDWSKGDNVTFRYVGADASTEDPGCAYTMDAYFDYEPVMTGAPVKPGDDGKPYWGFTRSPSKAGRTVAHLVRYKSCGGAAPTLINVSCAAIKAE